MKRKYLVILVIAIGFLTKTIAQVIVVQPHITIIPPFSPQFGFPTLTYNFNFILKNDGSGDVNVNVEKICPSTLTCSLSEFTSGTIVQGENKTTTLIVTAPYLTLPGSYIVGINASYDDAYDFMEIQPNFTLSNITFILKRAKLNIENIYIKNLTKVEGYWILTFQDVNEIIINVSNSGNLDATDIKFLWNIPRGWLIENVEYYNTIPASAIRVYKFKLIPTTFGSYTINFSINYTTSYGERKLNYFETSPLFNIAIKDRPVFNIVTEGDIRNNIGISGDQKNLNIIWNASFLGGSVESVNITCWLNCDPRNSKCTNSQSCQGFWLKGSCTIFNPRYNSTLECEENGCIAGLNSVVCRISDSKFPLMGDWAKLTFRHLAFDLFLVPQDVFSIGEKILPIYVTNKGLLKDSYNFSAISLMPNIAKIYLENPVENLVYHKTGITTAKLSILFEGSVIIQVTANSTTNSSVYKTATMTIRIGRVSLSDLDLMSLLQIILIAGLILLFSSYHVKLNCFFKNKN